MSFNGIKLVAVCGAGHGASPALVALAENTGEALARAGYGLVCGGRGGVMEGACRGAKKAGGLTVGILPGYDRAQANPYVDIAIPTGLGEARNVLVVSTGLAVIAVGGEWGTLSEIALAMKIGRPVIALAGYGWDVKRVAGDETVKGEIHIAVNPAAAVTILESLL